MQCSICKKPILLVPSDQAVGYSTSSKIVRFIIWLTAVTAAIPCAAFVVLASAWLVGAV